MSYQITILVLRTNPLLYKATRSFPELSISETFLFTNSFSLLKQLKQWLIP
ncbi:hypothetical protein HZA99_00805 [Candidatus Woesearchaeota archaeon]|nr:hypothetical protein [Candidatus Woesearchaeota archaeon]